MPPALAAPGGLRLVIQQLDACSLSSYDMPAPFQKLEMLQRTKSLPSRNGRSGQRRQTRNRRARRTGAMLGGGKCLGSHVWPESPWNDTRVTRMRADSPCPVYCRPLLTPLQTQAESSPHQTVPPAHTLTPPWPHATSSDPKHGQVQPQVQPQVWIPMNPALHVENEAPLAPT